MTCLFCDIANGTRMDYIVWKSGQYLAILDKNPCQPGHMLLIPVQHWNYLFEMPDDAYQKMLQFTKNLAIKLSEAMGSSRSGIIVEGFSVDHVHIHIVPISNGAGLDRNTQKPAKHEDLIRTQAHLLPLLSDA
jgi:histidine triad (HIT) family protein